jgi:hypothetical protein
MPTKICAYWSSSLCDMNRKQKGYRIGNFSVDCDHPLHWKVMFVMHAKNLQLIGILLLDNSQYPWED